MKLWPSRHQWKRWSLPSKLTALGALVGVISLAVTVGIFVLDRGSTAERDSSSDEVYVPDVALDLVNSSDHAVTLVARGEFILWLPVGVGNGAPSIPGKYELRPVSSTETHVDLVTIEALSTVSVYAHLENPRQIASALDAGSTDLEFIFRRSEGGSSFGGAIPFTRDRIEGMRWQMEIGDS